MAKDKDETTTATAKPQKFKIMHDLLPSGRVQFPPKGGIVSREQLETVKSEDGTPAVDVNRLLQLKAIEPHYDDETGPAPKTRAGKKAAAMEQDDWEAEQAKTDKGGDSAGADDGLDGLSKEELFAAAEEEGVEVASSAKKADILTAIRAKRSGAAPTDEGEGEVA